VSERSRNRDGGVDAWSDFEGIRALTEVQRRGIETATELFDRFIEDIDSPNVDRLRVDGALERFADPRADAAAAVPQMRAAFARTIDLYADLFRQTFEVYADLVEAILRPRAAAVLEAAGSGAPIALAGSPGREASGVVWIHNGTDADVAGVALRMTDLIAHDGARIEAPLGSFSPSGLDVAAAASGSATLSVRIPRSAGANVYYGHVLAAGVPEASVPTCLVVELAGDSRSGE
jgi:hypothetical protein